MRVREFSARDLSARVTRSAEVVEALARQYRILDTLREAAIQLVVHRPLPGAPADDDCTLLVLKRVAPSRV